MLVIRTPLDGMRSNAWDVNRDYSAYDYDGRVQHNITNTTQFVPAIQAACAAFGLDGIEVKVNSFHWAVFYDIYVHVPILTIDTAFLS